jgi:small subunit ribosomal protein S9
LNIFMPRKRITPPKNKGAKKTKPKKEAKSLGGFAAAIPAKGLETKAPTNAAAVEISKEESAGKEAKEASAVSPKQDRYYEAVGRRKTAIARVRIFTKGNGFVVNDKPLAVYFPTPELQKLAEDALRKMKSTERFRVSVRVKGGGLVSQAEAVRHGTARALVVFNPDFRKRLKRAGFLKRDPRMKERKKFGLKKSRRAPQWAKR